MHLQNYVYLKDICIEDPITKQPKCEFNRAMFEIF